MTVLYTLGVTIPFLIGCFLLNRSLQDTAQSAYYYLGGFLCFLISAGVVAAPFMWGTP